MNRCFFFLLLFFALPALPAFAEDSLLEKFNTDKSREADFSAKEVNYLVDKKQLQATGDVEVKFEGRTLTTDEILYDKKDGIIHIDKDLKLVDEFKNIYYADKATINDTLDRGEINHLRVKLEKGGNVFGERAVKKEDDKISVYNGTFTPCKICDNGRKILPFWQLRSTKTNINEKDFSLTHYNTRLNIYGLPVLYIPYITHNTNLSERKTGLLTPKFSHSKALGYTYSQPLYLNLAPNYDLTLTPTYYTKTAPQISSTFRHLTEYGNYNITGSATNPDIKDSTGRKVDTKFRGHINADGNFAMPDYRTNAKFNVYRASDDTYLSLYGIDQNTLLTSKGEVEKFFDNAYLSTKTIFFQGLEPTNKQGQTPYILPLINLDNEILKDKNGGTFFNNLSITSLNRTEGQDYLRTSDKIGYSIPLYLSSGQLLKANASIRTDIYSLSDLPSNSTQDDLITRVIPQLSLGWEYPLIKMFQTSSLLIKPIIKTVVSSFGVNKKAIPNEDSELTEISDINVFSDNYYTGIDVVDEGLRLAYGMDSTYTDDKLGRYDFLLAQIYRPKENTNLKQGSGLDEQFSHIVGRLRVDNKYIPDFAYRFRMDKDLVLRKNEFETTLNPKPFTINLTYTLIDQINGEPNTNQLLSGLGYEINENWNISLNSNNEFGDQNKLISAGSNLTYKNDCVIINTYVTRENFNDRDIRPSTKFGVDFRLKAFDFQ